MNSRPCLERRLTAACCGLTLAACIAAVALLTRGFEHWTFEERRRDMARLHELRAPPTAIRTSRGEVRTLFDAKGASPVYLVDFIDSGCPTICQALGSTYQRLQTALDERPAVGVQLLSLSFNVARDGQAELAAYARRHGARPDRWTVAAPRSEEGTSQLLKRVGVVVIADGFGGYAHNGDIHLIDASGVLRGIYDDEAWPAALAAARRLAAP